MRKYYCFRDAQFEDLFFGRCFVIEANPEDKYRYLTDSLPLPTFESELGHMTFLSFEEWKEERDKRLQEYIHKKMNELQVAEGINENPINIIENKTLWGFEE